MTAPSGSNLPLRVLVDCNFLVSWIKPKSDDDKARFEYFLETAGKQQQKIIIPTPVIAEYLVRADEAGLNWLDQLEKKACILVVAFDRMAAFECAQIDRAALGAGDKKDGSSEAWQKIKVDRQIAAIGKAASCSLVITEDSNLRSTCLRLGMKVRGIAELDLPMSAKQPPLPFEDTPKGNST